MRPTVLEIDLNRFKENVKEIQTFAGSKTIMPVVKAEAYGTYLNRNLEAMNLFEIVAVATCDEAIEIRNIGFEKEIFVLNQPYEDDIDNISKYNVTIGLSDRSFLEKVIKLNKKLTVHLEIETGMNRTGIKLEELEDYIKLIKSSNCIYVEGVYTHLSSADFDDDYTKMQLDTFKKAVEIVKNNFDTIKYIHSSASCGILNYDDGVFNLIRPGIIIYGYEPFEHALEKIHVKPVATLKSKVIFLKEVKKGESIGYSRKYKAPEDIMLATVPIGYADGYKRALTNKAFAVINGVKVPVVGSVCMDSIMINVSGVKDVKVGTDVYLWDNELYTIEEMADSIGTVNYDIIASMMPRVKRIFK
jgi:alanine racemase